MKNNRFLSVVGCSLFLAGSLALQAEEDKGKKPSQGKGSGFSMEALDTDGNGSVSLQEFKDFQSKMIEERFNRIDANGDKQLTEDEFKAMRERFSKSNRGRGGEGRPEARPSSEKKKGSHAKKGKHGKKPPEEK